MTAADLILPSFFADALALGPHWIYDADEISRLYPDGLTRYDSPRSPYHGSKSAGNFTHYGDQSLALLRSLADHGWSVETWRNDWKHWAQNTSAYIDGASKRSLENILAGLEQPSESSGLAGASRIAPLFAFLDGAELVQSARAQTAVSHGDPRVIDAAEFFARAAIAVRSGSVFGEAFDDAASHPYDGLTAIDWLADARKASEDDLQESARRIGLACDVGQAFPLALAVALKYEDEPVEALATNALLGGDSAARGLLLGLLLGAKHGVAAFPEPWTRELKAGSEIEAILGTLDA